MRRAHVADVLADILRPALPKMSPMNKRFKYSSWLLASSF